MTPEEFSVKASEMIIGKLREQGLEVQMHSAMCDAHQETHTHCHGCKSAKACEIYSKVMTQFKISMEQIHEKIKSGEISIKDIGIEIMRARDLSTIDRYNLETKALLTELMH